MMHHKLVVAVHQSVSRGLSLMFLASTIQYLTNEISACGNQTYYGSNFPLHVCKAGYKSLAALWRDTLAVLRTAMCYSNWSNLLVDVGTSVCSCIFSIKYTILLKTSVNPTIFLQEAQILQEALNIQFS